MRYCIIRLLPVILFFCSCHASKKAAVKDDGKIDLTIVQVNDVYEIAPIENGAFGGMARVAQVKKEEVKKNPNTWLVMAGDFLSPSIYNSLKLDGQRIRGRQMIAAMNAAKFDYAVFGNHEFDITENELQERIDESTFQWISSNTFHKKNDSILPFAKTKGPAFPRTRIVQIKDADGTIARIGLIGINIPSNHASYVFYEDPLPTARKLCDQLKDSCDAVIAITHQEIKDDRLLAQAVPYLPVIIGGHEHDMRFERSGNVFITKAHSNARSAYILRMHIDKKGHTAKVIPELKWLDTTVAFETTADSVVGKWLKIADYSYISAGFDPMKIVVAKGDSLEGREVFTRRTATNLTNLILKGMAFACPGADICVMNGGAIRLDDVLYPPISQYDILRSLPFGGSIREVEMKGGLLAQILAAGVINRGEGGFLHFSPVPDIQPEKIYKVALPHYLLTGAEKGLDFMNPQNPGITRIYPEATTVEDARSDIRLAIIRYLTK